MVQVIQKETPFGKLAENLGRSLGESSGTYIKQRSLSEQIPKLLDNVSPEDVANPLKLIGNLLSIQGLNQQEAMQFLPFVQQQLRQKAAGQLTDTTGLGAGAGVSGVNIAESTPQQTAQAGNQNARVLNTGVDSKELITTLMTPEQEQSLTQQLKVLNPQQITAEAYRLMTQNPGLYPTLETAEQGVRDQLQADNTALQNLKSSATAADERTQQIRDKTDKTIKSKLQVANLQDFWSQLPGTVQDNLTNEAIGLVRGGKTADQAAELVGRKALNGARQIKEFMSQPDFTDASLTLEDLSSGKGYDKKTLEKLSNYRSFFESVGALEEYKSLLQTKGAGEFMSSLIAYPLSTQSEKEIVKIKKQKDKTSPEILSNNLAKSIQPTDSIQSLAYLYNQEGLNEKDFYNSVRKLQNSGEIELSDIQQKELNQDLPVTQTLYDIFVGSGSNPYGFMKSFKRRATGRL